MITAVLTGDNHLGTNYARFRPEQLEERRTRLREAFGEVVNAAIEKQVDLFLHTGDLFDRPDPRNIEREFVAKQWRKLGEAGIPIFAIAGNHDCSRSVGYGGGIVPQEEAHALGALHLFRKTDVIESKTIKTKSGHSVRVSGITTDFNRASELCPLQSLSLQRSEQQTGEAATLEIVLLHYGIEGWMPHSEGGEPILSLNNLESLQVDFIGVGHLHQRLHQTLRSGALVVNAGSSERLDFGEERHDCGYTFLELRPGNVKATHIKTRMQSMKTEDFSIDNCRESLQNEIGEGAKATRLMALICERIEHISHSDLLLRFRLTGALPLELYHAMDLIKLQEFALARNFHCQFDTEKMHVYDPTYDLPEGYGVSFDVGEELALIRKKMDERDSDNEREIQINQRAAELVKAAYESRTKGARA